MIVTLTANPSNDRSVLLPDRLQRGEVQRVSTGTVEPGGKGVNVARIAASAGVDAVAVLPAPAGDPILASLSARGVRHRAVPIDEPVRTNLTLAEPDGTTTKLNEPGPTLDDHDVLALVEAVDQEAEHAEWVVLSGSLPPGAPDDLYATITARVADRGCRVAVDTSGAALAAVATQDGPSPHVLKPNAEELAELVGGDPETFEADAQLAARAAGQLLDRGVTTVLVTLGATGSLAVTRDGASLARPPRVEVRSTVGAGDSALTGWVLADLRGHGLDQRLRWSSAMGAAAVELPGSGLPTPAALRLDDVEIEPLTI